MHKDYHVFFSYARKDNEPDHNGWVTRFHDALKNQHEAMTGRPLAPFFDRKAIDSGQRWKFRLGEGLRRSRLFLAFKRQGRESELPGWIARPRDLAGFYSVNSTTRECCTEFAPAPAPALRTRRWRSTTELRRARNRAVRGARVPRHSPLDSSPAVRSPQSAVRR